MEERVDALVANLTNDEKSVLFVNGAGAVPRIGWPAYQWWSEALHGVARDGIATSFPQICGVAASYNRSLWHMIGDVTSTEGRGKNQEYTGKMYHGLTFWAPNVNIFRDPRWGRGEETPGEDPTMNGDYAEQFVTGMQGADSKYLKVSSCLKHYAAYNEEAGRNSFPAMVTSQDMEDTFLPAFQAGVEKGNASSIMCSYNAESYGQGIYGTGKQGGAIPSCANKGILNDLARDKWGFEGYITSDCGAVGNVQNQHHYTSNPKDTVTAVLTAGMDTDCGGFMGSKTMAALLSDSKVQALADRALKNLFMVQFRLGLADPVEVQPDWARYGMDVVNTAAHQALAKEAADQSMVLLKNTNGALPIVKAGGSRKIAVMGREAEATSNMQGNYFGTAPYLISPADGLKAYGTVYSDNGSNISKSVSAVVGTDLVVLVVGLQSEGARPADEAEGHDRSSLLLPDDQDDFVEQVSAAAAKVNSPVVVVVMGGGPLDLTAIKANRDVDAIMWCGYPGQSGGASIADTIFGQNNPSGKLSLTWYPEELTKQVAITDMGMRPNKTSGNPGRTYRFYTGSPVFKFGEGLSYSTFRHELMAPLQISESQFPSERSLSSLSKTSVATLAVNTTNLSERHGAETILVFAAPPNAGEDGAPIQSLIAFDKVHVRAGQTVVTELSIESQHFTLATLPGERSVAKGAWKLWVGHDGQDRAITINVV
jgi:beta-glucosidase-like glycosyl hydrolase